MTRNEATGGVVDNGSRVLNGGVQTDPTINSGSLSLDNEKSFTEINNADYGKYIGYMVRVQALASKSNLTPSEKEELQRVEKSAQKLDPVNQVNADKTLAGYWTSEQNTVQLHDLNKIRNKMRNAEKNNSVLWQDVVSFDNDFLAEQKIYDPKTGFLNERILHDAAKNMMDTLTENEHLYNPFWTVAIHRNTDNIHLHFSIVEEKNSRPLVEHDGHLQPRGNFKQSTIRKMKSSFSNTVLDVSAAEKDITRERQNIRENITRALHANEQNKTLQDQIDILIKRLPQDHRKWKYATLKKIDPTLTNRVDQITDTLLSGDPNYQRWHTLVNQSQQKYKKQYGNSKQNYEANKERDLKQRVGNRLLSDLAELESTKPSSATVKNETHRSKSQTFEEMRMAGQRANKLLNERDYRKSKPSGSKATDDYASKNKHDYKKSKSSGSRATDDYASKNERDYRKSSGRRLLVKRPRLKKYIMNQRLTKRLQKNVNRDYQAGLTSYDKVKALNKFQETEMYSDFN